MQPSDERSDPNAVSGSDARDADPEALQDRVRRLEAERDRFVALIETLKAEQAQATARLNVQLKRLSSDNASLKKQLDKIRSSRAWRLARAIGSLPRLRPARRPTATEPPPAPAASPKANPVATAPAVLPASPAPDVRMRAAQPPEFSVVIPAYKNLALTQRCVESIYAAAGRRTFEVVVVDNASGDGTLQWLRDEAGVRRDFVVVSNATNAGFAGGVNAGARVSRGTNIIICNNDVAVTDGWLDRLGEDFDADPRLAIVSPVTNYVGEGPQLEAAALDATYETRKDFGRLAASRDGPILPVVDRLVFFCVAVRRSVFDSLGGLSEDFGLGNFEDDDFCVRARMSGATLAVDPRVFVYHQGSATWSAAKISHTEWMERNRGIYLEKLAGYAVAPGIAKRRTMRSAPPVSVIVRTVDRPVLLREALASLAHQTLDEFEVVVVNDGGPDVAGLLAEFEGTLTIEYVRHADPRGRVAALNAGLRAATAPRISYLDDDDVVYPLHLELLLDRARSSSYPVVYSDACISLWRTTDGRSGILARRVLTPFEFDRNELLVRNRIPIQSMLHDASLGQEIGLFDESWEMLEDWDFLLRLSQRSPFLRVPRVTSEFRFRVSDRIENSISADREKVIGLTELVYQRHPVEPGDVENRRLEFLEDLKKQAERIAGIRASSADEARAALEINARLCGFQLPEADG